MFKAIELHLGSRQRTGRAHVLDVATRQQAIDALLALLGVAPERAQVDPTRTMVQFDTQLWTIVAVADRPEPSGDAPALRRAGAKHKRVR